MKKINSSLSWGPNSVNLKHEEGFFFVTTRGDKERILRIAFFAFLEVCFL